MGTYSRSFFHNKLKFFFLTDSSFRAATMSDDVKFRDISFGNQGDDKKNKNKKKEGAKQESQMENFETSHLVANLTVKKIKIKTKVKKEVNDLVVRSDYHGFTV